MFWKRVLHSLDQRLNLRYWRYRRRLEPIEIRTFLQQRDQLKPKLKFSVVTPLFGIKLVYVKELLASLQAQTYENWELCAADDGDPDPEVWRYMQSLSAEWGERIRLTRHEQNRGISAATRSALSLAGGDFVVFVDADDVLHPEALRLTAMRIAEFDDCDFVYTDHDFMTDWSWRYFPMRKPDWSPELLMTVNYINHLAIVRRSVLTAYEDFFPDEFSGGQDTDMVLKLIDRARRVLHVPFALYHWRTRPGSVAAGAAAKPWAFAAGAKAKRRYLEGLGLILDPAGRLRRLQQTTPSQFSFSDLPRLGREWVSWIKENLATLNGPALVGFAEQDGSVDGEIESGCAYAVLPSVGVTYPFYRPGLRSTYTPGDAGVMVRVREPRGAFSHFSGNVLAGPLDGLLVDSAKLLRILDGLERETEFVESMISPTALGVVLGLMALRLGFRNVCVDGAWIKESRHLDERVSVPVRLWPRHDNFV